MINDKTKDFNKGITLIALIITIIILLILAGVTIVTLTGENGLLNKAAIAKEETKKSQILEELKLKVLDIQAKKQGFVTLQDIVDELNLDTENEYVFSTKLDEIVMEDLSGKSELYVKYKNYWFKIDSNLVVYFVGQADSSETNPSEDDTAKDKILEYKISENNSITTKTKYLKSILTDLTGNGNNATLYNTEVTDERDGIIFDGNSSYAELNLQQNLTFPLTIEMDLKTYTKSTSCLIYLEPDSRTSFGIWQDYFICTSITKTNTFTVPSDFFDGTLKHIVIRYTTLTDYELYINGTQLPKRTKNDGWTAGIGTTPYLGRRQQGNYFNGIIYNFRIYNRLLGADEVISTTNRNDLILEYNVKNDEAYTSTQVPTLINDLSKNGNNATMYNIELTDDKKGIVFNGSSSYAELNLQQNLTFPLTIEMDLKTETKSTNCLIYLEPNSQISFGIYDYYFIFTIETKSQVIPVPSDFFDGTLKHIVIEYTTLTDYELYINGVKLSKSSSNDGWTAGIGTIPYLGRRQQGNYFNGIMYEFNIYNRLLTEEEITKNYDRVKSID